VSRLWEFTRSHIIIVMVILYVYTHRYSKPQVIKQYNTSGESKVNVHVSQAHILQAHVRFTKPTFHKPTFHKSTFHKSMFHKPTSHKPTFHKPTFHRPTFHKPMSMFLVSTHYTFFSILRIHRYLYQKREPSTNATYL